MNVSPEKAVAIRLWIEKAESDYKSFQNLLGMGEDCPFDSVCFHAQQCVEKYLKARLVYLSINFPKVHDLEEIIKLFPPGTNIPLTPSDQEKLTSYAWKGRYPGDFEPINRKQAEEAAVGLFPFYERAIDEKNHILNGSFYPMAVDRVLA
jgi:HEPN domain-containing protein